MGPSQFALGRAPDSPTQAHRSALLANGKWPHYHTGSDLVMIQCDNICQVLHPICTYVLHACVSYLITLLFMQKKGSHFMNMLENTHLNETHLQNLWKKITLQHLTFWK